MKREANRAVEALRSELQARDDTLCQRAVHINTLDQRVRYLTKRNVHEQERTYSVSKAHYCLQAWIARFRREKRALRKLAGVAAGSVLKSGLVAIRISAGALYR
jgi:hypothetical protein